LNRINTLGDIEKSLQDFSNIITLGSIVPDLCFRAGLQNERQLQKVSMLGTQFRSPNAFVPHDSYDFISFPVRDRARVNSNTLWGLVLVGFVYNVGSYHPQGEAEDCWLGDLFTQILFWKCIRLGLVLGT
jgi:hypothetical protein